MIFPEMTNVKIIPAKHPNGFLYAAKVADGLILARAFRSLQTSCLLFLSLCLHLYLYLHLHPYLSVYVYLCLYLHLYLHL